MVLFAVVPLRDTWSGGMGTIMRILIVEDDAILAFRMDEVLSNAGWEVVGFGWDIQNSLDVAAVSRPHLALVDLHLAKNQSGHTLTRELDERYGIPSIFVSASPQECQALANEACALGCLAKPFCDEGLIATVRAVENLIHGQVPTALPANFVIYPFVWA